MSIAQSLLPEFDLEMANTQKTLERVPDEHLDWRPHPKSMSLGQLASHIAELIGWGSATMLQTEIDLAGYTPANLPSRAEILSALATHRAATRAALAAAADADYMVPWTLKAGDQTYFTLPRIAVLRSFVFNHVIHHRAQLTVYFRLLGVPVPGLYGPSADEQ